MTARARTEELFRYINLKLAALGQPVSESTSDPYFLDLTRPLLRNHYQKNLLLAGMLCPADARIQAFLDSYLSDVCPEGAPKLPFSVFTLDRAELARTMSVPPSTGVFSSPYLNSYRVPQGVLHNPRSDRRTTKGVFHIVEGGLPVPADKVEVPKRAYAAMLKSALAPPPGDMLLPFTSDQEKQARLFVSLLLRPVVCPATGRDPEKTMEVRFFAPGSLVSNLDFVEGIFGNGGDPYLPENDAALDERHWTGHTGCVILAPHIAGMRKKDLGLPYAGEATARQRRDGMCWEKEDDRYNDGEAFKLTCRDRRGVIVTVIADNYYGYCKKEIKTQISFAANLFGLAEEEHAGGAIAFPAYVLGQEYYADRTVMLKKADQRSALAILGDRAEERPGGYAVDRNYPDILYLPETAEFHVLDGRIGWEHAGGKQELTLRPAETYILPSGYKIRLEKQQGGTAWRLVGSVAHGTFCHKPCTVSGGGKSEISKSISPMLLKGPVFIRDYHSDMEIVAGILKRDFSSIFRAPQPAERAKRPVLCPERSLGSVIKLLTPSSEYTDEYNEWLRALPQTIRQLVFTVKRYYHPEWGENWREHFTVDRINGFLGHELKFDNQKLVGNYLRMGFDPEGSWRIHKLRPDFHPADKLQMEDDITASVTVPRNWLSAVDQKYQNASLKLIQNCESLLFQRPDDAVHPGQDAQAESDIASPGTFLSNYEPLTPEQVRKLVDHIVVFDEFTEPMKKLLASYAKDPEAPYVVCSAQPRLVDGSPSKNPRYLQRRPDLVQPRERYIAEVCARLDREVPSWGDVHFPVNAVLAGRRGNPADPKIHMPPLAVYNPVHYQELPELFMDFLCSLTGKSPSTTGFGSEGALTKGPFNALWPVVDVNNALVSAVLTGYAGFTTAAGYVGPRYRMDHDISMLIPEVWCRMRVPERDPVFLIQNGYLEKVNDFEFQGRTVRASRLGYRITAKFVDHYLGRIFENPGMVFPEELLQPERQDLAAFVSGVDAIVEAQRRVAQNYFEDGSIRGACPPVRALLHILAEGQFEGKTEDDPEVRAMFTREALVASDWYQERLRVKQERDVALWQRHLANLEKCGEGCDRLGEVRRQLTRVQSPDYLAELAGTIGADPLHGQ